MQGLQIDLTRGVLGYDTGELAEIGVWDGNEGSVAVYYYFRIRDLNLIVGSPPVRTKKSLNNPLVEFAQRHD